MKILVFSDSHGTPYLMREAMEKVKPNAVIHLGDHYTDGQALEEEYPQLAFYQVPGNCDGYWCNSMVPQVLCCKVCGVLLYMTHGHIHRVKESMYSLLQDARASNAQAVLYGHTHEPDCRFEDDIWIFNPGSCGNGGKTCGLIEVENGKIVNCRIIRRQELEEMK